MKKGLINLDKEELTVEKLKTFKGFENVDEEKAQEIVFAIQNLAHILYEYTNEQEQKKLNNSESIEQLKTAA